MVRIINVQDKSDPLVGAIAFLVAAELVADEDRFNIIVGELEEPPVYPINRIPVLGSIPDIHYYPGPNRGVIPDRYMPRHRRK